jgi:hypothetical protein
LKLGVVFWPHFKLFDLEQVMEHLQISVFTSVTEEEKFLLYQVLLHLLPERVWQIVGNNNSSGNGNNNYY